MDDLVGDFLLWVLFGLMIVSLIGFIVDNFCEPGSLFAGVC